MRIVLIVGTLALAALPVIAAAQQAPQNPQPPPQMQQPQPPRDTRLDLDQIKALSDTVNALNSQIEFLQKKQEIFQRDAAAKIIATEQADEGHKKTWAEWHAAREKEWLAYTAALTGTPHAAIDPKAEPAPPVMR